MSDFYSNEYLLVFLLPLVVIQSGLADRRDSVGVTIVCSS